MFCPICGIENPVGSPYCSKCGNPFSAVTPKKNNIWMYIVPIIVIAFVLIVIFTNSNEKYVGTWNCKGYSAISGPSGDYMIAMILKTNGEYTFGQYGDLDNNRSKGTYTIKYEKNKSTAKGTEYYQLDFQNDDFLINGEKQNGNYTMNLEMELIKRNEALIINMKNYAMYYCYK